MGNAVCGQGSEGRVRRTNIRQDDIPFPGSPYASRTDSHSLYFTSATMAMNEVPHDIAEMTGRPQTPTLLTPAGSKTPPTVPRREFGESATNTHNRRASEAMEADVLSRRLKEFETAGSVRTRDRTPGRSPSRKRQRVYGDRYVRSYSRHFLSTLVPRSRRSVRNGCLF